MPACLPFPASVAACSGNFCFKKEEHVLCNENIGSKSFSAIKCSCLEPRNWARGSENKKDCQHLNVLVNWSTGRDPGSVQETGF